MARTARASHEANRARLRKLCQSYGISIAEGARILGRADNTLHRWMTPSLDCPPPDELVELLEYRLLKRYGKPKDQVREQETA